jgi:asparagine synthase (glutamine-hydrolysing)
MLALLAAALPMKWKIRGGTGKYALRRVLKRHLQTDIFNRPKQGFSAPIGEWMRGVLRPRVEAALSAQSLEHNGLLDVQAVQQAVKQFMSGGRGVSAAGLWHVLQLQSWSSRWDVVGVSAD